MMIEKLSAFLRELMLHRRQLALYPEEHPQVKASILNTQSKLNELFRGQQDVTIDITPDALKYQQLWLDKKSPDHRNFAAILSALGLASITFKKGLNVPELGRFNQLLSSDPQKLEAAGGLRKLLEEQQVEHISVVPIDYSVFQSSQGSDAKKNPEAEKGKLWENFLQTLQGDRTKFEEGMVNFDLLELSELLNEKLGEEEDQDELAQLLDHFFEQNIEQGDIIQGGELAEGSFFSLLDQLEPEAKDFFFNSLLQALDRHPENASELLKKIPPQLIEEALANKSRQEMQISSRLFNLVNTLVNNSESLAAQGIRGTKKLPIEEVRSRLEIIFTEEQQDVFLPNTYQVALEQVLEDGFSKEFTINDKNDLEKQLENQTSENNMAAILFELLPGQQIEPEKLESIQRNLLDLTRFFLDCGDFVNLINIYRYWSEFIREHKLPTDFKEQVLALHTDELFRYEVLEGFDLWDKQLHQQLSDYICTVGQPYVEMVVPRLGSAPTWHLRKRWMAILEGIGQSGHQSILPYLDDQRWYLVRNLLVVLGKNTDPACIERVQQLRTHPHPKVRLEVMRILFTCDPVAANQQLLTELNSVKPEIRISALQVAGLSRDPSIVATLNGWLRQRPRTTAQLELQTQAIRALSRIGSIDTLAVFKRILSKRGLFVSKRTKQLQLEIIQNLMIFPGPQAEELLRKSSTGRLKRAADKALEKRA
ncbi:MAG: hypothetical protein C0622_08770 [Desulfuromonas sp.]|nr:MAG: hypothetical protein C0622_08770 [Desulfuromonas sp.]